MEVDRHALTRARRELAVLIPLLVAVVVVHVHDANAASRHPPGQQWLGALGNWANYLEALAVLFLGWLISRDLATIAPTLFRRMDPATAGPVGFLIRLFAVAATVLGALAIAGVNPKTLAVGGAFTAVVLGLAAQQTLGNLFAGMVLLTAQPFRLGERVRLQAGAVGGYIEGIVSSLGLLYTTLTRGDDRIMIPNNVVLAAVVVPLREPEAVDVKARVSSTLRPSELETILKERSPPPTRGPAHIVVEEIAGDELVVRVRATPERADDGPLLADEVISALSDITAGELTPEPEASGDG